MEKKINAYSVSFVDLLLDAVCVVDAAGRFVFVSAAFERIFGYRPEEVIGTPMIELVAPEDRQRTLQAADAIMSGYLQLNFENRYIRKDGQIVHILWSARWSEADQVRIAVAHDITKRKQAESLQAAIYNISEAAHAAEDLSILFPLLHRIIGNLLPASNFSVAMYDAKDDVLSFPYQSDESNESPAAPMPVSGSLYEDVIRSGNPVLLTHDSILDLPQLLRQTLDHGVLCWLGVPLNSPRGIIGVLVLKSYTGATCYTEKDKELLQFVSTQVATAIERKQLHERLQYLAQYDDLTGLANRLLMQDRLEMAIARASRQNGRAAVLYIDLDKFKQVNDSFGHAAGDLLLKQIAVRMKHCVRASDTVARIGGDEFLILLENVHECQYAINLAEKIRTALNQPVNMGEHTARIVPSIGIAFFPDDADTAQQLLKHADEAMYLDKKKQTCEPM